MEDKFYPIDCFMRINKTMRICEIRPQPNITFLLTYNNLFNVINVLIIPFSKKEVNNESPIE